MQTTKHPYEFLARWDRSGRLSGAHAQFRYVTTAGDGSVIGEFAGAAEPVAIAGAAGFPLSDLLSEMQVAVIAELDAVRAERDTLAAQLAAVIAERDAAMAAKHTTGAAD